MKLSKITDSLEWFSKIAKPTTVAQSDTGVIKHASVNPTPSEQVDDVVLANECAKIEKSASSDQPYYYNHTWNTNVVSQLREYASVCGLKASLFVAAERGDSFGSQKSTKVDDKAVDKLKEKIKKDPKLDDGTEVEVVDEREKKSATVNVQQIKTANTVVAKPSLADQLKSVLSDPFRIEANSNTDHMKEDKWEKVTLSTKLPEVPMMTIGIIPVRGGEDYTISNQPKFAVNQNTMGNPKAIEQLAESTAIDNGARLAAERAEREGKKVAERKQWEQDAIDAMPMRNVIARGTVFPIGAENAQSGLNAPSSQMGVYAKFDKNDLPEKTAGEQIKEQNDTYRKSISRAREDYKWEEVRGTTRPNVSDIFVDELKKRLGK